MSITRHDLCCFSGFNSMDALRAAATLDSTDGQVATVSRTSSPPPLDLLSPPPVVAEYWCHTQVRVTKMKYVWTISNFSFCREEMGEVVKSSFFSCGPNDKLKWCLRINPKGLDEESREYLSLYLLLVNCGTKSEARAKFKFSILNAKREETKAMESQRAYRFVQGKDWGFKKFIRRDVLMDEANGLLPNDRLTILCEVSVVGEILSESGQVNNQPISVPECNLHEDIGSLLFKQLLTDVTLVVVSNNTTNHNTSNTTTCNNLSNEKCSMSHVINQHSCTSSHQHQHHHQNNNTLPNVSSLNEQQGNNKFSAYESTGEDDDEEDDGDELDEGEEFDDDDDVEEDDVEDDGVEEDGEDDDGGDEEDEDEQQQQENESERDEDTTQSSSYRESQLTFLIEDGIHLAPNGSSSSNNNHINTEQGEAEATTAATVAVANHRTLVTSDNHASSTSSSHPLTHHHVLSSSTLTPTTTTSNVPTKGVIVPIASTNPSPLLVPCTTGSAGGGVVDVAASSVKQFSLDNHVSNGGDWRSTTSSSTSTSSSNFVTTVQGNTNRDDREVVVRSNGVCDIVVSQRTSDDNWSSSKTTTGIHRCRMSGLVPSTSSALPTTTDSLTSSTSCCSNKVKQPIGHNNADVGSSSTTTSSTTISQSSSSLANTTPSNPLITSKEESEDTEESVEAETSGTSSRVRRNTTRRRNTTSTTTTTTSTSNRSRNRNGRDSSVLTTVSKAASTTSNHSNLVGTPSSSTTCSSGITTNQTVKCSSMGSNNNNNNSNNNNSTVNGTSNSSVVLRQFEAHKAILAARSPVFAAMFGHGMEESRANRVEITDMEPDTVAEVLRYIYTGQVVGMNRLAHELLAAADKYQLERLKTMCEEALVESLSVENACDIFGLADMHNAEQLKTHTLEFIMLHAHDVCETEGYEQLVRHRPRLLNECFRSLASQQLPLRCWARKRPRQS
ncbi:unnamed protein product [Schistosoma turkestanicum]|nr:unnamed protein product [Schistosoma turkestanicum]